MLSNAMIVSTWQLPLVNTGNEVERTERNPNCRLPLFLTAYTCIMSIHSQYRALLKAGYAAVNHATYQKPHVRARIRRRFSDPPNNVANLDLKSK